MISKLTFPTPFHFRALLEQHRRRHWRNHCAPFTRCPDREQVVRCSRVFYQKKIGGVTWLAGSRTLLHER